MTTSELQAAYAKALSGYGVFKLTVHSFRAFAAYALAQGAIVSDVEVYEDHGDAHVIRTDLCVWPYPHGDLPWTEKVTGMEAEIARFLRSLADEHQQFLINVWLDDNA